MNKSNIAGCVMGVLLPFSALADTELVLAESETGKQGEVLVTEEMVPDDTSTSYSKPGKVSFSINLGSLSGEANERVYYPPEGGRKISQLDWKYDSAPILKGSFEWDLSRYLSLGLAGWTTVARTAGKMNDYDWLNAAQEQWTHHSYHSDTDLKRANELDINLKGWLINRPTWRLGLLAGYQDTRYSFDTRGGIFNYWNGAYRGEFKHAKAISYEQRFTTPYIGVAGNYRDGNFEAGGLFKYSAWVDSTGHDNHYFRNITFKDDVRRQEYLSLAANLGYQLTEHSKLFLEGVASIYINKKGDMTVYNAAENSVTTYKDVSGIENYSFLMTLGWKYGF